MAPTIPIEFVGQKESKKGWLSKPMGKSRKYSKGHTSGFVPDYRHAVGTMGESEGFGTSGRVDTEMTASEDSCAPKRKCISLNVDTYDSFGVPMQVLSLSKMSKLERKDLELRLKQELEQVRLLQRKVVSYSLSPTSDIHSCIDGQKRHVLESVDKSYEVSAPQSKKHASSGHNGARTKKNSGRYDPMKPAVPVSVPNAMLMKQCENLLNRLMGHQFGWVFNTPVDVVKLNIPDYFSVIKHPMDLGTVKIKITSGEYSSPLGFAADVRLTFSNAMKYNPPGNDVHMMAQALSKQFESRWKAIQKKLPVTIDVEPAPPISGAHIDIETSMTVPPSKKRKITSIEHEVKSEPVKPVMTAKEKRNLSIELESLLGELPESIIDFLKEQSYNADQTSEDEIEIDIDALSDDTLFKLRKLLDCYLVEKQQKQAKAEPCEMELINESGFSNSSLQQCKGNDAVDEDIDIVGGNEPPISSYPTVEIEKDASHKKNERSSSSSSSSESGSSSGSDSGNPSGSESDADKASGPSNVAKENEGSGENIDHKSSAHGDSAVGDQSINRLMNSENKPIVVGLDAHQEGESAPSERQVSPEKLYRAAIVINRFADTILKAQEKALEKVEKRDDPEKLRMEREELERRQKEEKARLQAEARAAEEAWKKAEAKAAAEARRQRELEREAARQALLQMEKTVEINENSKLMEDLEMLRTVQDEELPSFLEEDSPDHSLTRLSSFKLQGSNNPLEQLGLFMKEDVDEEEEVELPQIVSEPVKDVEEGEID